MIGKAKDQKRKRGRPKVQPVLQDTKRSENILDQFAEVFQSPFDYSTHQRSDQNELQPVLEEHAQAPSDYQQKYDINQQSFCGLLPYQISSVSCNPEIPEQFINFNEGGDLSTSKQKLRTNRKGRDLSKSKNAFKEHTLEIQQYVQQRGKKGKNRQDRNQIEKKPRRRKNISCRCKKSQCLKSYCQCFVNNLGCGDKCNCLNCGNNPQHSEKKSMDIELTLQKRKQSDSSEKNQVTESNLEKKESEKECKKGCNLFKYKKHKNEI